jgi:hypothetical protein
MSFDGKLLAVAACLLLIAGSAIAEEPVSTKATKTERVAERAEMQASPEAAEAPESAREPMKTPETAQMAGDMAISEIAVCEEVQERVPVGEADAFPSEIGQLWCFTRVQNAEAPTQIFHRWYVGDNLVDEIAINVGSEHWRCWSTKTILPNWTGDCRVEILTEEGDVIMTKEFVLEG